jgi:hypothetical protein
MLANGQQSQQRCWRGGSLVIHAVTTERWSPVRSNKQALKRKWPFGTNRGRRPRRPLRMTWRSSRACPSIWPRWLPGDVLRMSGVRSLSIWQIHSACATLLWLQVGWHASGGLLAAKSLSHSLQTAKNFQMLRLRSHAVQHAFWGQKEWVVPNPAPMHRSVCPRILGRLQRGWVPRHHRMDCRTWASMTVVRRGPR